ncbi:MULTISPECIES: ABC transporter permease [Dehalobacter]|jgi:putative ABC transport system permease protein|uniref:FtsX-like permease family protein n=2 Tax=Dehalobacter restrictus TaxID=55583 RepID=A0A857DHN8_9FIRM|nr:MULTISPECIES: ABC transporter permease [Dehalobacter]AHF09289.1 ABC transporter [Dehalobacter restrictus DSM 9455]MCG1025261.1 ABC transporter permease [Dehalobacter sp.]MDJ0305852.1 ABC transporter permease [Dehalobacter sp.]OCZ52301.1 lipoprotein ABC transporter permease [Dehalobacter sp. TeCB1]QGZ99824.1 FtsX-like permease family protein [Dehalobacter restrictus]
MYFKLSFRNVRKSFSDYTLYFLTLTFGVCVFYVFNSLEAQKAMMHISDSALAIMQSITKIMNGVSIFISFILGFLIIYANNFLIRRRKREFGIYMTLGMEKHKIARILIMETFIIGLVSLAAGLLAGIFLSQGLSVVTAKLFEVDMTAYTFVFSLQAFWKTIVYFGIIFAIVIGASTFAVSKYKLIDLINSVKQNEKQRLKNPWLTLVLFLLAIILIGAAYRSVLIYGIMVFDRRLLIACILGAVGTVLFFASLSGFLLSMIQANKKVYLKGLNMFILKQINSRINTAFISISLICLMLFATIGIFSTGIGMTNVLNKGYKDAAPFDITITGTADTDLSDYLSSQGLNVEAYTQNSCQYPFYEYQKQKLNLQTVFQSIEDLFPAQDLKMIRDKIYPLPLYYITQTDYNKIMMLQNKKGISLAGNQVALLTQYAWSEADYQEYLEKYLAREPRLNLNGTEYTVYPELLAAGINNGNENGDNSILTLVLPDRLKQDGVVHQNVLCLNCVGDSIAAQDQFMRAFNSRKDALQDAASPSAPSEPKITAISKNEILAQAGGSKAIISFVGIYVGLIFLITSAAVLALQQLSEAADNRHRYAILKKIGADHKLLSRTIFKQIAVYFLIPLTLACIHSIVGIKVANEAVRQVGSINAVSNIVITAVAILLIYGAYFLATYFGSRNIILKNGIHDE